ncbi:hypothetical protein BGZ49_009820 [Haplosporangium sp. Z 27]|nr:hypothetical protein BGZ49_009820 [Haplosporangium sp. Z 27]
MVAITKSLLLLLGTAIVCATATKTTTAHHHTTTTHKPAVHTHKTTTHHKTTTKKAVIKATTTTTSASKPTPTVYSAVEMAQVVDCQVQCIDLKPPFGHKPDMNVAEYMRVKDYGKLPYLIKTMQPITDPCHSELLKLKGNSSLVTEKLFNNYVNCDGQTLRKNNDYYNSKAYNYKKHGFNSTTWARFKNHTLPAFTSALHICRGGCRRIHFAHRGPPPRPTQKP